METSFKERLEYLLDISGLQVKDLYIAAKKTPNTVRNYKLGITKPDWDFLQTLKSLFPNLNGHWILFGEGSPFIDGDPDWTRKKNNKKPETADSLSPDKKNDVEVKILQMENRLTQMLKEEVSQLKLSVLGKHKGVSISQFEAACA